MRVWRVGNHDWCACELCGPVQRREESHCCQELDALEDKRSDDVGKATLYFPSFYSAACSSFPALNSLIRNKTEKDRHKGGGTI